MSTEDDPPKPPKKKFPRASWEPPEPDEESDAVPAAPLTPSSTVSGETRVPSVSPKGTGSPGGSLASGSWDAPVEPSVVVEGVPSPVEPPTTPAYSSGPYTAPAEAPTASGSYTESGAAATSGSYPSGSYTTPPSGPTTAPMSTSGAIATERPAAEPLLPLPTSTRDDDDELRMSVGIKPKKAKKPPPPDFDDPDNDDDLEDDGGKRRGKLWLFVALIGLLGLGIGALVLFGSLNKERFLITCQPEQVIAKQGRGFPPWGEREIDDEGMWKPIKIPPEAECRERETEDIEELSRWYLEILVDRASSLLTAREVTKIDEAAGMLEQALLHARAPDRRGERREIERLLGDVGYWRASAKLKDAATSLTDAAKQFDAAAAQRPRHVSDASAWATYVRKIVDELKAGPNGQSTTAFPPTPPPPDRQPAPPGVALPVEPGTGSGSGEPPPAPVDAGLPTGGVLL